MSHRTALDMIRRARVVAILGALTLAGCATAADDPTRAGASGTSAPVDASVDATLDASPDATVVQGSTIPAGWPAGLDLPRGATLLYSTVDADGMSLLFDAPPDLAALNTFLDTSVTAQGFRPESNSGFVDMLSRSWTDGTRVVSVTATPVDGRISGVLMVRPVG